MVESLCNSKLRDAAKLVRVQGTFMFSLCVLNTVFCFVAIVGNLLVIRALWKASSIPITVKALFLSLAASDFALGLIVQPMFVSITAVMFTTAEDSNYQFDFMCPIIFTTFWFFLITFATSSFLSVTAVALDRFLAVSLHLRYQELVTPQRVVVALVLVWVTSGVAGSIYISIPKYNDLVIVFLEICGILITTTAYVQISRVLRRHQHQIKSLSQVRTDQAVNAVRVNKSAISAFYVYAVFLGCYLPSLIISVVLETLSCLPVWLLIVHYFSGFIVFLNSSINPLIYCWRNREVRDIVKNTLKNLFINGRAA